MKADEFVFAATRLWRYLTIYFLKPFDAVNDTLTASLLSRLDWNNEYLEIGSGDGVFSFVMHGGAFPLSFDRYLSVDTSIDGDIYDNHVTGVVKISRQPDKPRPICSVDRKKSHILKIKELGYSLDAMESGYEELPFDDNSIPSIFFYTPHGLEDHAMAINEAARVLSVGGKMLILVYDPCFSKDFLCYRLAQKFGGRMGRYFSKLDAGRRTELMSMARAKGEWQSLFSDCGLEVDKLESGLSGFAWRVYDIQTRPFLKPLIALFAKLPMPARKFIKFLWMCAAYPFLLGFYFMFSNRAFKVGECDCYIAYQLRKVSE